MTKGCICLENLGMQFTPNFQRAEIRDDVFMVLLKPRSCYSDVAYPVMQGIDTTCKHICLTEEFSWVMAEFPENFQKRKVDEFPVSSATNLCSLDP
ncbi:hypothetical protein DV515_00000574 [Chloebia gouldiae]|uniref:Uncharacterized protein n=1 Tax=Chloebia gouldiae TaxID=44316 RepID=A0A3L8T0U1_CHLGU|nr:hypothetical protein DV515_00000574 [Chloebia gouldiae]